MKPTIGVMEWGGTLPEGVDTSKIGALADHLGKVITENGCILITGATNGTPDLVARAVRRYKGFAQPVRRQSICQSMASQSIAQIL